MLSLKWSEGQLRLVPTAAPKPAFGEQRVRVRRAGICNTDLELIRGYMGFSGTLGHEFVGEVIDGQGGLGGQRVAGEINIACGRCPLCARGFGRHCPERSVLGILSRDGCFAEYVCLPAANLHPIPDNVGDEAACFIEPIAAAFEILEQLPGLPSSSEALVIDDGKLGLLIAMVLQQQGLQTHLAGRHQRKLALAQACGVRTVEPDDDRKFDLVVEATGSEGGLQGALARTKPRGTLILKSTYQGQVSVDLAPLVIDEITLLGSRCGPFEPAIRALATGALDPTPLIDQSYPLQDGMAAFEHAGRKGALKILLTMPSAVRDVDFFESNDGSDLRSHLG